jgi:hypothetical protein
VLESGALQNLQAALEKFPMSGELAQHMLELVSRMAKASPEIAAKLKEMVRAAVRPCALAPAALRRAAQGIMDTVVRALEAHPDNAALVAAGREALRYLADRNDVGNALT